MGLFSRYAHDDEEARKAHMTWEERAAHAEARVEELKREVEQLHSQYNTLDRTYNLEKENSSRLLGEERERCARIAESPGCACKAEDLHDGCCGACGKRIAEKIRGVR